MSESIGFLEKIRTKLGVANQPTKPYAYNQALLSDTGYVAEQKLLNSEIERSRILPALQRGISLLKDGVPLAHYFIDSWCPLEEASNRNGELIWYLPIDQYTSCLEFGLLPDRLTVNPSGVHYMANLLDEPIVAYEKPSGFLFSITNNEGTTKTTIMTSPKGIILGIARISTLSFYD